MSDNEQEYHAMREADADRRRRRATLGKRFRRNRQPKPPRRKNWIPEEMVELDDLETWDESGSVAFERIMPRDENDRRRSLEKALAGNGGSESGPSTPASVAASVSTSQDDLWEGLVIEMGSGLYQVEGEGERLLCSTRGLLHEQETGFTNPAAVGDRVLVRSDGMGGGVIEQILPRHGMLTRPDVFYSHLRQIVAANVDQVLVIASWREPQIWFELMDRYLIAAGRSGLPAILCVNKLDLARGQEEVEDAVAAYRKLAIPCLLTSVVDGRGIEELRRALSGRCSVLAGLSGVGKSSLLTALAPDLDLRTAAVSTRHHEGRHTTTQATLLRLDAGTTVIDTPGMREFGLAGLTRGDLAAHFPEFLSGEGVCQFRNCHHLDEPGCAVRRGVDRGIVPASRYDSYRKIYDSLP